MRARSRDINIFSMSALDLFASALGAFILIAVMLFPYFPNTGDSEVRVAEVQAQLEQVQSQLQVTQSQLTQTQGQLQAAQSQLGACETQRQEIQAALDACEEQRQTAQSQLGACESRNQQLESDLETCQAQARKKFLLVIMSWGTRDDIDLHVIDPAGREFYFGDRSFSGSRAKLEEDNTRGPGNEIWLHPAAEPGTYRVYYNYYDGSGGNVQVRGAVLTPEGRTSLPDRVLRRINEKPLIATIEVDADGNMRVSRR